MYSFFSKVTVLINAVLIHVILGDVLYQSSILDILICTRGKRYQWNYGTWKKIDDNIT